MSMRMPPERSARSLGACRSGHACSIDMGVAPALTPRTQKLKRAAARQVNEEAHPAEDEKGRVPASGVAEGWPSEIVG